MEDQQQPTCIECGERVARWLVLVPWVHLTTGEQGSNWDPCCRACIPTAEDWQTIRIGDEQKNVRLASSFVGN